MHLHILSDLHLEFEPFMPPAVEADAVILAGDVSTGRNGLKWALKNFPDRQVIYVLGNHEFYGQKVQKLIKELQEMARGTNVLLLENQSCTIGDVLFLGATLWTDFALNGNPVMSEVVAQASMKDYRRIRTLPRYSRLKPSDTRRFHMESRRWLEDQAFAGNGGKVVVVNSTVNPSPACGANPVQEAHLMHASNASGGGEEWRRRLARRSLISLPLRQRSLSRRCQTAAALPVRLGFQLSRYRPLPRSVPLGHLHPPSPERTPCLRLASRWRCRGSRTNPYLTAARLLLKPGRKYGQAVTAFEPYDSIKKENPEARAAGKALIADGTAAVPKHRTFIYVSNRLLERIAQPK